MNVPRRILAPIVVLLAGVATSGALIATRPRAAATQPVASLPRVRVVEVRPEDVQVRVRSQGTVAPRAESQLVAEVAGRVVWISPNLTPGAFFQAGEPLLRIDAFDYAAAVESAEAERLVRASENDRAQAERERFAVLLAEGIVSRAEVERVAAAAKSAAAALRAATAALTRARRDHERTELAAPYDGRVRAENVDLGQFVARGATLGTVYAVDQVEVRLPVDDDDDLAFVDVPLTPAAPGRLGPETELRARFAGRERSWRGRVVRTDGQIDPRTRLVHLVARVDDPFGAADQVPLGVGMFVEAEIAGRRLSGVFRLPRSALRPGPSVQVVDGDGRLRSRAVELVRALDDDEVLVSGGIGAGERVALSAGTALLDGTAVQPVPEARVQEASR